MYLAPNIANIHILAVVGGAASALYLHRHPVRGHTAVLLELAFGGLVYTILYAGGASGILKASSLAIWIVLIQIFVLVAATVAYRLSPFHPLAKFPGPFMNKITSLALARVVWSGKRYLVVKDIHAKYGRFVRTGPNTLSINSATAVSALYGSSNAFNKSDAYTPGNMHGVSLFFIRDRETHTIRRKRWAPAFTPSAVESYAPVIERKLGQMLEVLWKRCSNSGYAINLTEIVHQWSFDVMNELTYGGAYVTELMKDGDPAGYVRSGQVATAVFETLGHVPSLVFDLSYFLPIGAPLRGLERLGESMIKTRARNSASSSNDLSSYLLGEHDPSLLKLSMEDLKVDSSFAIQAGSETTASVILFMFYYLLRNHDSYLRLQTELDEAFPDPAVDIDPKSLNRLVFLHAVCEESLRLGTPFGGQPRVVPRGGHVFDDVFIPEGTIVGVPGWTSQTNPENVWPEPDEFRPQRWMPGGLGPHSRLVRHGMLSFSFGPFGCLGRSLAFLEMKLAVAKTLLTCDLEFLADFDCDKFIAGIDNMRTKIMRYPLLVTIRNRSA